MLPMTMKDLQEEATRESRKAKDALTRCTVCLLSDQLGELKVDAKTQQAAEDFWVRNFDSLIKRSVASLLEKEISSLKETK